MNLELGMTAIDRITGFEGVVVGSAQYISGCNQLLLSPAVDEKGAFRESHWFDEQRCERVGTDRVILDNGEGPGFDKAAPKI
jgi:hypothetical protein